MIGSGLTGGGSLALGFLSVKPCTRWLKLVGGEMSLERTKGSFSISLRAKVTQRGGGRRRQLPPAPGRDPLSRG